MVAIIAFVNQKGGCAKSTTAVHYAHWLVQQGKQVLIVDADAQRSSSQWCSRMEPSIPTQVLQSPDDLLDQLTDLVATVDCLVVDGPAGLSEATRAILMRADESGGSSATERYRRTISRRCGETHQTSSIGETKPAPSGDVSLAVR